tara:strand:- start:221 stop:577 length:357 start_codon:yes stop_codon:yes gene_type:complete
MTLTIDAMMTTGEIETTFIPNKIEAMCRGNSDAVRKIIKKVWHSNNETRWSIYNMMSDKQKHKMDFQWDDIGAVDIGDIVDLGQWMPKYEEEEDELMLQFYTLMRFMKEYSLRYVMIN